MTVPRVALYYDLSSPWTYLAFVNLHRLLDRTGDTARLVPVLVGGVFNAVNASVYASRETPDAPKVRHGWKALQDWARWTGVPLVFPSPWHPVRSVLAMRMACALEEDQPALAAFSRAAFDAYFGAACNLDDPAVLAASADAAGLDGAALVDLAGTDSVKERLRANTESLIARGGYGSPTMFVDGDDMYFGNDQLLLVEAALAGR